MTYGSYMWECGLQMRKIIEKEDEDLDKVEVKDLWLTLGMKMGKGVDLVWWPPAASLLSSFKLLHWETSLQVCNVLLKIDQSLKQKTLNFHQYPGCELFFGMNVWKLLNPLIQDFIRAPSHPHCGSIKVVLKQNAKFRTSYPAKCWCFLPIFSKSDS